VKLVLILLVLLISPKPILADDAPEKYDLWEDSKDALDLLVRGSYLQFTEVNNLATVVLTLQVLSIMWGI
jgi:hypothetical protein